MANRYQTKITKDGETVLMTRAALAAISPEVSDKLGKAFPFSEGYRMSSYACTMGWPFTPLSQLSCTECDGK